MTVEAQFRQPEASDRDTYLDLVFDAVRPHLAFSITDEQDMRALDGLLYDAGAGEHAAPFARVLWDAQGVPIGACAAVRGHDLERARLKAARVLHRAQLTADVKRRLCCAGRVLCAVGPEDLYLARFAVASTHRGRGCGVRILRRIEREAADAGALRIVLDVTEENTTAVKFYEKHGFCRISGKGIQDPASRRRLSCLHFARVVPQSGR